MPSFAKSLFFDHDFQGTKNIIFTFFFSECRCNACWKRFRSLQYEPQTSWYSSDFQSHEFRPSTWLKGQKWNGQRPGQPSYDLASARFWGPFSFTIFFFVFGTFYYFKKNGISVSLLASGKVAPALKIVSWKKKIFFQLSKNMSKRL